MFTSAVINSIKTFFGDLNIHPTLVEIHSEHSLAVVLSNVHGRIF